MTGSQLDAVLSLALDGKVKKLSFAGLPNVLYCGGEIYDLGGKHFQAAGWDECFPTIDPYKEFSIMGELIGGTPEILRTDDVIEQIWRTEYFEARRAFSLETPTRLKVSFLAINRRDSPLEFLWASHALFTTGDLREVRLGNAARLSSFDLNGTETKFFIANMGAVELGYSSCRVVLTTDQPWWGIWLNRGGWHPQSSQPFACIGIEPTNTPGERPMGDWLQPGESFLGTVHLEVQGEYSLLNGETPMWG